MTHGAYHLRRPSKRSILGKSKARLHWYPEPAPSSPGRRTCSGQAKSGHETGTNQIVSKHVHCAIPQALMGEAAMVHHCGVSCWPRWGVGQGCWVHADGNAPQSEQPIRPLKVPHETCVQCCILSPTRQCGGWAVQGGEQLGWCVRQGCKVHAGSDAPQSRVCHQLSFRLSNAHIDQ